MASIIGIELGKLTLPPILLAIAIVLIWVVSKLFNKNPYEGRR